MEEKTIELDNEYFKKTNIKRTVLYTSPKHITVIVKPMWNSHGDMSIFGDIKVTYGRLMIFKETYTQMERDWETWFAKVGEETVASDISEYNAKEHYAIIEDIVGCG
jgi:hypothetical protein